MNIFDSLNEYIKKQKEANDSQSDNLPSAYKIATILSNGHHEYPYAQCLLILANDVSLGHREICDQSVSFLLPQSEWNHIVNISNNRMTWLPDMSEFTKEDIFFPGLAKGTWLEANRTVWRHRSVPGANGQVSVNAHDINEIPSWEYKMRQLYSQYNHNGWSMVYPSFKEYVMSLAEGDDVENFWGWLFDNNMLSTYDYWTLPAIYKSLFNVFLSYCEE